MKLTFQDFRELKKRFWAPWLALSFSALLAAAGVLAVAGRGGLFAWDGLVIKICALTAAFFAFWGCRRYPSSKRARTILIVVFSVIAAAAFWAQSSERLKNLGNRRQMNIWGVYHYYLGVKYFDELGYTDLYEQTLAADAEGDRYLDPIRKIRNLRTYKREKISGLDAFKRSDAFSDERWREFKSDVDYIIKKDGFEFWRPALSDRGYNASPAWHFFALSLIKAFPLQNASKQTILILIDVFIVLFAFGFSVRAYGLARSLLVLCAFYLWFGNPKHLFGQIYILDWFAACWAAISAWRMGWARTAGILLGYATMVRIFPAALFLGPLIHAGAGFIRERRLDKAYKRFFVSAILCAAVLFAIGGVHTRHGFDAWKMFASEIALHSQKHLEGERRLGLGHIFTIDFSRGLPEQESKKQIRENAEKNELAFRGIQLVMLALLLLAIRKADEHDALLLGAALVFIGTIASRYYGSVFVFLLLLGTASKWRGLALLLIDASLFLLIWAVHAVDFAGVNRYADYVFANVLLFVWFAALLFMRAFPGRKTLREPEAPIQLELS